MARAEHSCSDWGMGGEKGSSWRLRTPKAQVLFALPFHGVGASVFVESDILHGVCMIDLINSVAQKIRRMTSRLHELNGLVMTRYDVVVSVNDHVGSIIKRVVVTGTGNIFAHGLTGSGEADYRLCQH